MRVRLSKWLLLAVLCWPGAAAAQYCNVGMGNINFGTVNGVGDTAATVSGSMGVYCSNASTQYVRVCIALGAPVDGSWDPRYLMGPNGARLAYNIYTDPGHTQIWGSAYGTAGQQVAVDVPIAWGSGQKNVNYYAKLPVQNGAPAGSYYAVFAYSSDAAVRAVGYNSNPPACTGTMPIVSRFEFSVNATVDSDCTVSATPLAFGTAGTELRAATLDATSTISATCTMGLSYALSLNAGTSAGATVAARKLTRTGGNETLSYGLYSDAARSRPWGDGSSGTSTVTSTGSGVTVVRTHTVYARLPPQSVPPPGNYADTVTVTITY
jgi:spore coat protein U-like protein